MPQFSAIPKALDSCIGVHRAPDDSRSFRCNSLSAKPLLLGSTAQSCRQGSQTRTSVGCRRHGILESNSIPCVRRSLDAAEQGPDTSLRANRQQSLYYQIQAKPKRNRLLLNFFGHSFFLSMHGWTKQFQTYLRIAFVHRNTFEMRFGQKKNACVCGKPAEKTLPKAGLLWIVGIVISHQGNLEKIGKMGPMRKICRSLQLGYARQAS